VRKPVGSMPGVFQTSVDELVKDASEAFGLGVPAVLLFGIPQSKDETGSLSWHEQGVVQRAVRALKQALPQLLVITDVCMCEYTSHGHCGVLHGETVATMRRSRCSRSRR
jgi:porphobilinogen synthase